MNKNKLTINDFEIGSIYGIYADKEGDIITKYDIQIELKPLNKDIVGDDQIFISWLVENKNYSSPTFIKAFSKNETTDTDDIFFKDNHIEILSSLIDNHIKKHGLKEFEDVNFMKKAKLTMNDFKVGTICAVNVFDKESDGITKYDIQIELEPLDWDSIGDDQIFASWWVDGEDYTTPEYVEAFSREGRNDTENILFQESHLKEMLNIINEHINENGLRAY